MIEHPKSQSDYLAVRVTLDAEVTRLTRAHKEAVNEVHKARTIRDEAADLWQASHPRMTFNQQLRDAIKSHERPFIPPPHFASPVDREAYYRRGDPNDPNAFVRKRMRYGSSRGASPVQHPKKVFGK